MSYKNVLVVLAMALVADAGLMGPPMGYGMGGPPGMGGFGSLGPPPFVQALIASKSMPGPAAGSAPGAALGPPPFVQALIASKGKFGVGAAPSGAPGPVGPESLGLGQEPQSPQPDPTQLGPPAYVNSLLAAKAAAGLPFVPTSIPMGPPPFVMQLIAAKNAAAAQAVAEEAAQMAALQQQMAAGDPASAGPSPPSPGPMPFPFPPLNATPPQFAPNLLGPQASPPPPPPPAGPSPQDWLQQLIQSSIAKKLASKTPAGVAPAGMMPLAPPPPQLGPVALPPPSLPPPSPEQSFIQERRDTLSGAPGADALGGPQQQAPQMPMGYPYPPMMSPMAPIGPGPVPYPMMMPFYPPIPFWKVG